MAGGGVGKDGGFAGFDGGVRGVEDEFEAGRGGGHFGGLGGGAS